MNDIQRKIIDSAKKNFLEKGYEGASIRDISTDAGVNIAMVNYYFRSKENLFQQIFLEIYGELLKNAIGGNNVNLSLREKIELLVSFILDNVSQNPKLPLFVLMEINRDSENLLNAEFLGGIQTFISFFQKQIQEEIGNGNIRKIEPIELFINIVSMCLFPFLGYPVLERVLGENQFDVASFMNERKIAITDFVMNSIRVN